MLADRVAGARNRPQPFDRREHRQSGGDDRVAVEQRRPGSAEHQRNSRSRTQRPPRQRGQRQHAAFALIVGAHQEEDIFDSHDEDQRPEGKAEHAQNLARIDAVSRRLGERLTERVERAGADIAEDDANRADGERQHRRMGNRRMRRRFSGR